MSYSEAVLPKDAPLVQIRETRRAFYAGAAALNSAVFRDISSGPGEPTDEDLKIMADVEAELKDFGARVKQGLA